MILTRPNFRINLLLLLPVLMLVGVGILFVYSASSGYGRNYMPRQAMWAVIGICVALPLACINARVYRHYAAPIFVLGIFGLLSVLVFGEVRNGARCWLGIGSMGIQPSEFAKLAVIVMFGRYLEDFEEHRTDYRYYGVSFLILFIPLALILLQPDLGTALVFMPVVFAMFFVSGTRTSLIASTFFAGLLCVFPLWMVMSTRQKQRIKLTWHPELDQWGIGYQAIQSKIAVGSGELTGRGLMNSLQSKLNFLPERHTDFIFSVIGEEWGFLGSAFVLCLYAWLILVAFYIARTAKTVFCEVVAVGIGVLLATHVIMNIGMAVGVLPIIGLPLPLVSYGGSAMITTLMAIGLLQAVYASEN